MRPGDLLNDGSLTERDKASQLLALADHLGLVRQPSPQPLPAIDPLTAACYDNCAAAAAEDHTS